MKCACKKEQKLKLASEKKQSKPNSSKREVQFMCSHHHHHHPAASAANDCSDCMLWRRVYKCSTCTALHMHYLAQKNGLLDENNSFYLFIFSVAQNHVETNLFCFMKKSYQQRFRDLIENKKALRQTMETTDDPKTPLGSFRSSGLYDVCI